MTLTTFGIYFLIGAALSLRFKVLILPPAIGLTVVGTAGVGIAHGDRIRTVILTIALLAVAMQIGYLFGLVARAIAASPGVSERKAVMVERLDFGSDPTNARRAGNLGVHSSSCGSSGSPLSGAPPA
jgi:hypothetical protein